MGTNKTAVHITYRRFFGKITSRKQSIQKRAAILSPQQLAFKKGDNLPCTIDHFADGDTVILWLHGATGLTNKKVTLRIADIDSYEIRSCEKLFAEDARRKLNTEFKSARGELFFKKANYEQYGRIVGDVLIEKKWLSQMIVERGLGWFR